MQVADTVVLLPNGGVETLTRFTKSGWGDVSYEIKDEEESAGDASDFDDDLGSPSRCARALAAAGSRPQLASIECQLC